MKRFSLLVLMLGMGMFLFAQSDEMKPTKHEGSTWYSVGFSDIKPGKVGEVKKIIKMYMEASDASGTQKPELYWLETGEYDMMVIWELEGGPSDLEWKWSPRGIKWYKAFLEQVGSEEEAEKIQEEFNSYMGGGTSYLVRKDAD